MNKIRFYALLALAVSLVLACMSLLVPTPDNTDRLLFQIPFFLVVFSTTLYISSALLFIHGLKNFKVGLKVSYAYICAGVSLWGLAILQLPLLYYFNFWYIPWITYGLLFIPGMIGTLLVIAGGRKFASILGISTRFSSFAYVILTTIIAVGITTPLPRIKVEGFYPNDIAYYLSFAFGMSAVVVSVFGLMLFLRIKQGAGRSFTNPLAWFILTMAFHVIAGLLWVIPAYIPIENAYFISGMYFIPYVFAGLTILRSSYSFNKIGIS